MTPTARSLQECRRRGWLATVVEKWNSHAKIRVDAFGFGDVLVLDDDRGCLMIQATSASNASKRIAKIRALEQAQTWLDRGNRIQVWAWGKRKRRLDGRLWYLRVLDVTETDHAMGVT